MHLKIDQIAVTALPLTHAHNERSVLSTNRGETSSTQQFPTLTEIVGTGGRGRSDFGRHDCTRPPNFEVGNHKQEHAHAPSDGHCNQIRGNIVSDQSKKPPSVTLPTSPSTCCNTDFNHMHTHTYIHTHKHTRARDKRALTSYDCCAAVAAGGR